MPNPVTSNRYLDAQGVQHTVPVRTASDGAAWQVVDISEANTAVIEILTGVGDGRPDAEAIAREYVREKRTASGAAAARSRA
jgi:hypothetical protein